MFAGGHPAKAQKNFLDNRNKPGLEDSPKAGRDKQREDNYLAEKLKEPGALLRSSLATLRNDELGQQRVQAIGHFAI